MIDVRDFPAELANVRVTRDEIRDFTNNPVWLAVQQIYMRDLYRLNGLIRRPELPSHQRDYLTGHIAGVEEVLRAIVYVIANNTDRPGTDASAADERTLKTYIERKKHNAPQQ